LDEFGGAIAADLMETYGVDVRGVFTGELSPDWVFNLIAQLPVGSRFYAERRGGAEFRGWDQNMYAQAAIVNAIRALQFTYVSANSKNKPKPPDPFPVPDRPVSRGVKSGAFAQMALAAMQHQSEEV
jgi:hypothetical protein